MAQHSELQSLVRGPASDAKANLNPLSSYLEMASHPVLADQEHQQLEEVDRGEDLFAAVKVHHFSKRLWASLLAECLGLAIFQIYGGSANDEVAAFGNGITLAILIYATANVSGGHLNPAVTFANCLTGHMSWGKGGQYIIAQLLGAVLGAFIESGLVPGISPGDGHGPGCFTHTKGVTITRWQLWWWEAIMTFTLVSVVYATAVTKPGHGSHAPLAIGFTLFASAFVGGPFTGAALNPARVLGPALVFSCYWDTALVYVFAELLGGLCAAITILPLYGFGNFGSLFDTRIFGWLGLSVPEHFQVSTLSVLVVVPTGLRFQAWWSLLTIGGVQQRQFTIVPNERPASLAPSRQHSQHGSAGSYPAYRGNQPANPAASSPQRPTKPSLTALAEADRAPPFSHPTRPAPTPGQQSRGGYDSSRQWSLGTTNV